MKSQKTVSCKKRIGKKDRVEVDVSSTQCETKKSTHLNLGLTFHLLVGRQCLKDRAIFPHDQSQLYSDTHQNKVSYACTDQEAGGIFW